jgi:hypothetical protein
MHLTTWQKSCALFDLDPGLAGQLANFSVLQLVAVKKAGLESNHQLVGNPSHPAGSRYLACGLAHPFKGFCGFYCGDAIRRHGKYADPR